MALEGATPYYKKLHSIHDQVCMNTYERAAPGDDDDYIMFYETIIGDVCTRGVRYIVYRGPSICGGRFFASCAIFRRFCSGDKWEQNDKWPPDSENMHSKKFSRLN